MNILKVIKSIDKVYSANPCTLKEIKNAEEKLGFELPDEYYDILEEYGTISFLDVEFKGVNSEGYLNVVDETLKERENNSNLPLNMFILENKYTGELILSNTKGEVFSLFNNKLEKISDSICKYIEDIIKL